MEEKNPGKREGTMSHIALYRAWRPQLFHDIVGQNHITRTLQNALKEGRFSHAYLFSGPRGTGKTSAAKILAKAVNCEKGSFSGEPCNECSVCKRITEQAVMDVIEIDAASNRGVEEIRDIRDKVKYAPTEVRYKVYIIDEVHMLTTEAFNALLKTLEEPPRHAIFVLATTEPNRIPPTIVSRCQRFDFRRVSLQDQIKRIEYICKEENISAEPEALQYIARLSGGGMRDALSLLDQIVSFSGKTITYDQVMALTGGLATEQFARMADALVERDVGKVLHMVESWVLEGKHLENSMASLIQYFRDLLLLKMLPDATSITSSMVDMDNMKQTADRFEKDDLFQIIDILNHYSSEMKYASHPQTILEIALMKICSRGSYGQSVVAEKTDADPVADHSVVSPAEMQAYKTALKQLTSKVTILEQQLEALKRRTPEGSAIHNDTNAQLTAHVSRTSLSSAGTSGSPLANGNALKNKQTLGVRRSDKLQMYLSNQDEKGFAEITSNWNNILQAVKERKITVHAWLVDGEPVAYADGKVLVAFKNTIHRVTTEKPANKQLIEEVMQQILSKQVQLDTVMLKEWESMHANKAKEVATPELLELEPEETKQQPSRPEWVEEALRLFGEELVEIKDEGNEST